MLVQMSTRRKHTRLEKILKFIVNIYLPDMIFGPLVPVLCCLLDLSDSSPAPLFNLLGGNSNNNNGGGCRPGYEYIVETTYQTSYEQQCRFCMSPLCISL